MNKEDELVRGTKEIGIYILRSNVVDNTTPHSMPFGVKFLSWAEVTVVLDDTGL